MDTLTYNQARAALELVLNELQSSDLDVEALATLYRRGQGYAKHCAGILETVEQEVLLWDTRSDGATEPVPYTQDAPAED
ncbi:MAG: exodeoxyribonuclease VII small subunit [Cyanobacteriota bacterium]|nr:exodeoxyribonuclease VII small subunit [Cyanobacteriota bacterium]